MNAFTPVNGHVRIVNEDPDVKAALDADLPQPINIAALIEQNPSLAEVVIDGYLRRGETMNVIASPKVGKSWLVLLMAFKVAMGGVWIGARCRQGRVLIIDNELHPQTIASRMRRMAEALDVDLEDCGIDVLSVRGEQYDIAALADLLERYDQKYLLIVFDALYRFLPAGTSENDNAHMMLVYNLLDAIAKRMNAALAVIHHSSKGNQGDKAQTDVGAGAGSISRAADTHLTIRPHEEEGYNVLEAVTRSFLSPEPKSIYFNYPLWDESEVEPKVRSNKRPNQQASKDQETKDAIVSSFGNKTKLTYHQIRKETGFGLQRVQRGMMLLSNEGIIKKIKVKSPKNGQPTDAAKLLETPDRFEPQV